jgi:hypothetical protein
VARPARRERLPFGSSVPLLADAPLLVVLELAPVLELGPLPVPEAAPIPLVPALPGVGSAAPIWPAAVPAPARPALSVSAGEPWAAYAPVTATDMQPAIKTRVSFLMTYLPKNDECRDRFFMPPAFALSKAHARMYTVGGNIEPRALI